MDAPFRILGEIAANTAGEIAEARAFPRRASGRLFIGTVAVIGGILVSVGGVTAQQARAVDSVIGVDRAISRGGLDLTVDEDDEDADTRQFVDEKVEQQKRVTQQAQKAIKADRERQKEDFFHQDYEDKSGKPDNES